MAPKQPCAKYQYVVTPAGPKILPVDEPSCKDEESPADYNAGGYLPVKVGDSFKHGRYRVIRKLGWGHFSTVWLVKDTQTHSHSALKVVKSAGRYAETARDEIKLLSQVSSFSPTHPGRSHIVSFLDSFSHQGPEASHICIVFEPLGENLLALIERNKKKGVPRPLVKMIAKQILLGLQYLHDECDLVHTDIKPENILISIPDIEAHIHNELSQSPTPTSRRVGVPLPTKSRAGVSIPSNQQRARRQVQIFDSQPLASPGRSAGRSAHGHTSLSMSTRLDDGGSGGNSQNNSFIAQMHLSRMAAGDASPATHAMGTTASLGSSAPKVPSALSQSAPLFPPKPAGPSGKTVAQGLNSPSTSSSSSSISSALASVGVGSSSTISTPPTSLSHSFNNPTAAGFLGMKSMNIEIELRSRPNLFSMPDEDKDLEQEREGLPMKGSKGKTKMTPLQNELESALSTSWRDKLSPTIASSYKSTSSNHNLSKPRSQIGHGHSRSHSGAGFWKDPGTGVPAPVVLVSAVARADEEAGDSFPQLTVVGTGERGKSISESSSATTTVRPSPTATPPPGPKKSKTMCLINGVNKVIAENKSFVSETPSDIKGSASSEPPSNPSNLSRSLLTQTAPSKVKVPTVSPLKRNIIRNSPPQQVSQLSAHMHMYCPPSHRNCSDALHDHSHTTRANKPSRSARVYPPLATIIPISPTSVTPTPISPTPAAPPPTPITSPTISPLIPYSASVHAVASGGLPSLLSIQTPSEVLVERPPPISVKIADLGNATPSTKHYTEDIQTRQYRAPEAIVGRRDWDARADIWSVACVIFELLTAEYLFDPQGQGELFTKDDDHMAQIIELLGDFPLDVKMGGKYSRELFDHTGALRYIRTLKPWPLKRVMMEKYLFTEVDAMVLCSFLEPMLMADMRKRVHARDIIEHSWLELHGEDEAITEW